MSNKLAILSDLADQIRQLDNELISLRSRSNRFTNIRLIAFILGGLISGATLVSFGAWAWFALTFLALFPFAASVFLHRRVEEKIVRHDITVNQKRMQVARMRLDWTSIPAALPTAPLSEHPFAADLDIVGDRSLHQLVDTAVSREGSQRLCDWLLETRPDRATIVQRQAFVKELMSLHAFRDELNLNARLIRGEPGEKWPGNRLLNWLEEQLDHPLLGKVLLILIPLALVNMSLGVLNAAGVLPAWWVVSWLIFISISFAQARKMGDLFQESFYLRDGLERLGHVFGFLEDYSYDGDSHLRQLCQPFLSARKRPSQQLMRVKRVVAATGLRRNFVLWFWINAIVPWDIYFARQLNQSKRELAELLPVWLDIWFELEALNSLAEFAFLNPESTFPILQPADRASDLPPFAAEALGHPLIPDESRICNDFTVDDLGSIFIITGSNMAGKSTFLRTLGVNLVLAYAGGPVFAKQMNVAQFRLFTAVRVTDSVVNGLSYFYAEVRRLKELLDALEDERARPLFFLIDEIFRGTNNRERLLGGRAYVRALAGARGVGVIATHDLELVKFAAELPHVTNYHFRDDVQDGQMVFDYKLHPGPCPTTNALKIMRLAGLPVGDGV